MAASRSFAIVLVSSLVLALAPTGFAQPDSAGREHLLRILPLLSGQVMLHLADRLGVTDIYGKALIPPGQFQDRSSGEVQTDNLVSGGGGVHENEPSIAVNPQEPTKVVAGMHYIRGNTVHCAAFWSTDGGATWSKRPIFMRLLQRTDSCADPVVRWSPDGTTVYFVYMSFGSGAIVVSRSSNNGGTWSGPVVAIRGQGFDFPDKPWVGVHAFDTTQAGWVYVTTTNFRGNGDCDIVFSASSDKAATFPQADSPTILASSSPSSVDCNNPVVLQGSNITGGTGGNVLACWYNSKADGWLSGAFDIKCRSSTDHGATWGAEVTAVSNLQFELPFWMCPTLNYYRLWGAMFPQVRIASDGSAHMAFTKDPTSGAADGECGDVVYIRSVGPPYSSWTDAPVTISSGSNTNTTAQNYATISIEGHSGSPGYALYVAWVDQRLSPNGVPNLNYDIFDAVSTNGGVNWGLNSRRTSASSLTDFVFIGDYIDSTSTVTPSLIRTNSIWTDRRDKTSILDFEDDVFQSSVVPLP